MQLIKKILYPTDFGESMESAMASAINIAKKFESELILLHVLPEKIDSARLKELVEEKMEEYMVLFREKEIDCSYVIDSGNPTDVILDIADRKNASFILLGAGKGRKMEFKLGSNSDKIIKNSPVPVWVIEKDKPVDFNTVLCPVDFSEESKLALDNAAHICRRFNSNLRILNVVKSYGDKYKNLNIDFINAEKKMLEESSKEFDSFLEEVNLTGVNWEKEIKTGRPSDEILNYISDHNIDLVLMGSTGKEGLKLFVMGSVTEKVMRTVPCSFIISKSESLIHLKLEKNLEDIDLIYQEGIQLEKDGYLNEAIAMWKRCTVLSEYYLKAWSSIALAYENLGEHDKANSVNEIKLRIQKGIWDKQVEADLRSKHNMFK